MKKEPCWQYRKGESKIFQTRAEIPENEGWRDHWLEIPEGGRDADVIASHYYDTATLEEIFDQEGINGLRIVGQHFSVKSKSKDGLIRKILGAQNDSERRN